MTLTLRNKGIFAFVAIVTYVMAITFYISHGRLKLLHIVEQLESVHAKQQLLIRANTSLGHSITEIQGMLSEDSNKLQSGDAINGALAVATAIRGLKALYPEVLTEDGRNLENNIVGLWSVPSRENLTILRDSELKLIEKLNEITMALHEKSDELSSVYRDNNHTVPLIALGLYMVGLGAYGLVMLVFFNRLASDIKKLETRALAVVGGYRGDPLQVTRHDEVGGLMKAVNRMQAVLRHTEQQQEISRQQRFHQEKMAAVGSLAAAIGHEVSNPMAAISGITQEIIESTTPPPGLEKDRRLDNLVMHDQAVMILKHTERIATIMRQMSTLTDKSSPIPELLDLNELVRATCGFIAYDKRFRNIGIELDLNPDIPAVTGVADHLTQILMNLLINAADAMEGQEHIKLPTIRITSHQADGNVLLTVTDTGHGMNQELLAQAFTEYFSTKPVGKGRGIGLFLCKTLIEEAGGSITLDSTPGVGTTARLSLPVRPTNTEVLLAQCRP